ncbi:hypothetical protein Ssi03_21580 [Sphaerisporangium siamense]|uniref:transposase n=1 Tax=Sphaerisporangium siamense TaxID=795645 RepID=UPI001A616B54|nr:hypothetical protein Ssi03_21580 [Sphaerisporangium siamense]
MPRSPRIGRHAQEPPEFRRKVLDLLKSGRTVPQVAADLQISDQAICNWRKQDHIDAWLEPSIWSCAQTELAAARRRITELENVFGGDPASCRSAGKGGVPMGDSKPSR